MKELTQKYLKECFDYNPDTGILTWKVRPRHHFNSDRGMNIFNHSHINNGIGDEVGYTLDCGHTKYIICTVGGKVMRVHRIIWMLVYGNSPNEIDHKNRNGCDNRITNLRSVTHQENQRNKNKFINNSSGFNGVNWNTGSMMWLARISVDNKRVHLGYHKNKIDAVIARKMAEYEYGYNENHGRAIE